MVFTGSLTQFAFVSGLKVLARGLLMESKAREQGRFSLNVEVSSYDNSGDKHFQILFSVK